MPSIFTSLAVPALALAGSALANPLKRDDACLAAVTGKAALGDENLRSFHCSSFIKTIVTPAAITVTTTITDAPAPPSGKSKFKRDVTVCPNDVPNYASACDLAGYKSACKVFGISSETTYTIPATTTTKTVYAGKGGDGSCTDGTATVTSTITIATGYTTGFTTYTGSNGLTTTLTGNGFTTTLTGGNGFTFTGTGPVTTVTTTVTKADATSTVTVGDGKGNVTVTSTVAQETVTVTAGGSSPAGPSGAVGKCVTKERADALVNGFIDLLQYTSYAGNNYTTPPTPAGRGYHYNVSADIFDDNFFDVSDSINWMAGFEVSSRNPSEMKEKTNKDTAWHRDLRKQGRL